MLHLLELLKWKKINRFLLSIRFWLDLDWAWLDLNSTFFWKEYFFGDVMSFSPCPVRSSTARESKTGRWDQSLCGPRYIFTYYMLLHIHWPVLVEIYHHIKVINSDFYHSVVLFHFYCLDLSCKISSIFVLLLITLKLSSHFPVFVKFQGTGGISAVLEGGYWAFLFLG